MKVLQINTVCNWGSTGRIAEEIGQCVINEGWQSFFLYGRNITNSKSNTMRVGNNIDMVIHGIESRLLDNHGLSSRGATKKAIKLIDSISPDVIHLHNIHGYYLNYEILFDYIEKKNIPIVWTLHDCWPFTGHCAYFSFVNCSKWKYHCEICPQYKA